MRRHVRIAVACRALDATVYDEVKNRRSEKMHRGFGLREFDILPTPGAAAIFEGGQNGRDSEARRDAISIRAVGPRRRPIGPSAEIAEAAHRGREIAVTREPRKRSRLSHQAATDHDNIG